MMLQNTRNSLFIERILVSFSSGLLLILPLYFKQYGWNEVFFAKIFAFGAIGTILCVSFSAFLIRFFGLKVVAPFGSLLFFLSCILYITFDYEKYVIGYYIASLIQGAGWGLIFTIGPICISTTLDNQNRSYYFTIYAAYSTLGIGIAPLFARIFSENFYLSYKGIFILAACTSFISFIISCYSSYKSTSYKSSSQGTSLKGFKELIYILKSPSVYFFIMVFLGACIYTTIINLQTTFAKTQGLDYVYFYSFYSLAVVLARFFISKPLNIIDPKKSISFLLTLMIIGLIFMCFAINSIILYIAGALLLGLGYGLVYPIIQAQVTNYSPKSMQAQTLVYFSLAYFIAVYLFPYFGAFIATEYSYDMLMYVLIFLVVAELITVFYFYKAVNNN